MKAYYFAPMAEISHRALREIIEDFGGCDVYFSEMISAAALLAGGPFEKWYIDAGPKPEKLVFQLVGSDPQLIAAAAALLDERDCAGIDINMGCSAPLIRKSGAGVAFMASLDRTKQLISLVRQRVKRRLSVKLRIGYKEDFEYLVRFCRCLEGEGVELITLHPRTAMEKFKRVARWEYVAMLRQELKIPVAGNGDVKTAQDLVRRAAGPCDAVMVGRAAVQQPWIFAEARSKEKNEQLTACCFQLIEDVGLRFLERLACYQPPEFYVSRARRFFAFYCDNLKWGTYLKNRLNREETPGGFKTVWRRYFAENER